MPSLFHFSPVPPRVSLNTQRKGEASFTVSNASGKPIRGRARVRPQSPAQEAWFTLAEERERDFDATSTTQYTVQIAVPGDAPAGTYAFRLDVMEVEEPEENYTEGPTVTFEVREAAPPPSRPFPWWILAVGVVVIAVVLAILLWPRQVMVPDMELMTLAEAEAEIEKVGLVASTTTEAHDTIEEGQVIRTDPPASSKVDKGSTVALTISSGVGQVTMPDVVGMTEAQARDRLKLEDLAVTISRENHDTIAQDQVIRTKPSEGNKVDSDSTVTIVLSDGPVTLILPDVTDRREEDAKQILQDACEPSPCFVVQIQEEHSDDVDKGRVIRTSPAAGAEVNRGDPVKMIISSGPEITEPATKIRHLVSKAGGKIVPDLAVEWQHAPLANPPTWEFGLQSGVRMADGRPFDAHLVKEVLDAKLGDLWYYKTTIADGDHLILVLVSSPNTSLLYDLLVIDFEVVPQ
jgi:beta-lactam-binding protein with PASTA domain